MKVKLKFYTLGFWIMLMASAIVILDVSYLSDQSEANLNALPTGSISSLPTESGVFERSRLVESFGDMSDDLKNQRTLEDYYKNRAYNGAPPVIPHPILNELTIGENTCLQCHKNGGFVEQFKSFAPITPHPELTSCTQCHVAKNITEQFISNEFEGLTNPGIGHSALPGSPPVIPHDLNMRSNCLSCHAGPSAPKEIRVSHPERSNCRQCHLPAKNIEGLVQWLNKENNPDQTEQQSESIIWERIETQ